MRDYVRSNIAMSIAFAGIFPRMGNPTKREPRSPEGTMGWVVFKVRLERGLTQVELAHLCGIGQSQISSIEAGDTKNTKDETLLAVAKALDIDPSAMRAGTVMQAHAPAMSDALRNLEHKLNATNLEKLISYGEGLLSNQVVTPFRKRTVDHARDRAKRKR